MAPVIVLDLHDDGDLERNSKKIFESFCGPWVVKPAASGSSVGVTIVKEFQHLPIALHTALSTGPKVLVEQFIRGREATVGVAENYRGEDIYAFFPVEIVPPKDNTFYDYDAKYLSDNTEYVLPGNFTDAQKKELSDISKLVHKELALSHYSRSDFIVTPRGVFFLEVNTLPGLTSHSLIPKSVRAAGGKLSDFFEHLLTLAIKRK